MLTRFVKRLSRNLDAQECQTRRRRCAGSCSTMAPRKALVTVALGIVSSAAQACLPNT